MEKIAYVILLVIAVLWIIAVIIGFVAIFPAGIIGLILVIAIGLLFIKVLKERFANKEDDYYDKNVKQ
jgi:hypothetical protein